jgi:hypothetical protein
MLDTKTVTIALKFPSEKKLCDYDPSIKSHIPELAMAMDYEISMFNRYMMGLSSDKGGGSLVKPEADMLRAYIAWKLLYEASSAPGM